MKAAPSNRQRWLSALVVAAAVVVIFVFKGADRGTVAPPALPTAERSGSATVVALAETPEVSESEPNEPQLDKDPLPADPAAQVEWVLHHHKPAMVLFHSTTCKACLVMMDVVERVRTDHEAQIVFIDVVTNDRSNAQLVQQAQIRTIPTSIFITTSGQAFGFIGAMEEDRLRTELSKLIPQE